MSFGLGLLNMFTNSKKINTPYKLVSTIVGVYLLNITILGIFFLIGLFFNELGLVEWWL